MWNFNNANSKLVLSYSLLFHSIVHDGYENITVWNTEHILWTLCTWFLNCIWGSLSTGYKEMNLKFNPGFQETYCLYLRSQRVSQERNQHERGSNYWLLFSWSSSKKLTLFRYTFSFSLPLCKAVTLATLYQCALYFLPTDYEQSKYVSSSSGFFLVRYQCHEFYLQSLYFTTLWIVFVCISWTTKN
jgi:hypothetical protein